MTDSPIQSRAWELADEPTIWFAVLQRARRTGKSDLARQARLALTRLGVRVSFRNHHPRKQTGSDAEGIGRPRRGA